MRRCLGANPSRLVLLLCLLLLAGCGTPPAGSAETPVESLTITSPAFTEGGEIPIRYTCDGDDVSPPLQWSNVPEGVASFALIVDDPDAPIGTWVHWVLYDLPAGARSLPEAAPADDELTEGGRHGHNSWRKAGYGGPCPPSGIHRYIFQVYALDTELSIEAGATAKQLRQAMDGHILAQGQLTGVYGEQ